MQLAEKKGHTYQKSRNNQHFFSSQRLFPSRHFKQSSLGGASSYLIQREATTKDPCETRESFYMSFGNIPPGLNCDRGDLDNDPTTSCCNEEVPQRIHAYYVESKTYTDRAISRMIGGIRVNEKLAEHFNSDSPRTRDVVLENIRRIRAELNNEFGHIIRCRAIPFPNTQLLAIRQENPDAFCRWSTQAFHTVGTNYITMCVNMDGRLMSDWDTLVHEVVHLTGIGNLTSREDASTEQQRHREFETYAFQREEGLYPNPNEYALRNADSYAEFIKVVRAPDYSDNSGWPGWAKGLKGGIIAGLAAGGLAGALLGHYGLLGDIGVWGGLGISAGIGTIGVGLIGLFTD